MMGDVFVSPIFGETIGSSDLPKSSLWFSMKDSFVIDCLKLSAPSSRNPVAVALIAFGQKNNKS